MVALATGCSTAAAVGTVGVAAGIGAVQGGLGAAATGGNVLNGAMSGAINATVSLATAALGRNQYVSQFAGGFAGNIASDMFDNIDNPGTYSAGKRVKRAVLAGGIQALISGSPAHGAQISGMNDIQSNFVGLIFGFGSTFTQAAGNQFFPSDKTDADYIDGENNCVED